MMIKKIKIKKVENKLDLTSLKSNPEAFAQNLSNDQLGDALNYLSKNYYNGLPLVTDRIFDKLQDILRGRDPEHAALSSIRAPISNGSGTVGEIDENLFKTISGPSITNPKHRIKEKLPFWMGSMDKNKPGESGLASWFIKYPGPKCMSDKMDGMSGLLLYIYNSEAHNKLEAKLMKSGDGVSAEDVSCFIPYLKLPTLNYEQISKMIGVKNGVTKSYKEGEIILAIRLEMIISLANYKPYSKLFKNPRNMVAGVINSKTIKTILIPLIDLITYEVIEPTSIKASDQFTVLENLGFETASNLTIDGVTNIVGEKWLIEYFTERRKQSLYEIDGIIVCDDKIHPRNTSKNPKYAFAFKMILNEADQIAETEVLKVEWTIQKDGYMFPVVQVKPTPLSGITIQNCSGKNAKFIVDNCIGTGAILKITRDGEVIPGIYSIVKKAANGQPELPDPIITPYHWTPTGVDIILNDIENNEEVQLKRIITFFQRMKVVGFSKGLVARCVENGLDTIPKILNATMAQLMELPGIQEKMAQKIFDAIKKATQAPNIKDLMVASNAFGRGFGERKIDLLLRNIPDVSDWDISQPTGVAALTARICQIQGFEEKTAGQFAKNLHNYKDFVETLPNDMQKKIVNPYQKIHHSPVKIITNGQIKIKIKPSATNKTGSSAANLRFQGKTVVFTGFRNPQWEKIITDEGGKVTVSVSGNTAMVIIKNYTFTSSKITKAQSLGIPVLDMEEFKKKYSL